MTEQTEEKVARMPNLTKLQRRFILECLADGMGPAKTANRFLGYFRFYGKDSGLSDKEIRDRLKILVGNMKCTRKEEINEMRNSPSGYLDPYYQLELLATIHEEALMHAKEENDRDAIKIHSQELRRLTKLSYSLKKKGKGR